MTRRTSLLAVIRLVSWNMAHRRVAWAYLNRRDADVALLQEAGRPDPHWALSVATDATHRWETTGLGGSLPWRTAVARLSDQVELRPRSTLALEAAAPVKDWVVSRASSIAAADRGRAPRKTTTGQRPPIVRPDESTPRHGFTGQLLARVHQGMSVTFAQDTPGHLRMLARQIMNSRITVDSGGPIGYLEVGGCSDVAAGLS